MKTPFRKSERYHDGTSLHPHAPASSERPMPPPNATPEQPDCHPSHRPPRPAPRLR